MYSISLLLKLASFVHKEDCNRSLSIYFYYYQCNITQVSNFFCFIFAHWLTYPKEYSNRTEHCLLVNWFFKDFVETSRNLLCVFTGVFPKMQQYQPQK